jgi:hypothetical protein
MCLDNLRADNCHKRSISNHEDDDVGKKDSKAEKANIKSPRVEAVFQKYYEVFDKKGSLSTSTDWKKSNGKVVTTEILLDKKVQSTNYLTQKNFGTFKINSNIKRVDSIRPKGESKTTINTKPSSRKNSLEKNAQGSAGKNLFLLNGKQNSLKMTNHSSTNSTILAGGKVSQINLGEENSHHPTDNSQQKKTLSGHHSKMNSEIPSLNMIINKYNFTSGTKNLINTANFILNGKNPNATTKLTGKKKDEDSIEKSKFKSVKSGPVSIPLTSLTSKNHSKNNSKSASRIEEVYLESKNLHSNNPISSAKYTVKTLSKKVIPVTTTSSPTHSNLLTKELIGHAKKDDPKNKEKISLKIYLDINNLKKVERPTDKDSKFDQSFEDFFNNSNESIISTMRESNYYKKEADRVINYLKKCKAIIDACRL